MVDITGYVDPGVRIGEVQVPGSISITSSRTLAIIGTAPRTKRATDEVLFRGKVYNEELASWSSSSPYTHLLTDTANRNRSNATLYKNGRAMALGSWSFVAAALVGTEWSGASVDVSSNKNFTITLDGKRVVTIDLNAAVTTVGGTPATASAADICDAINYELGDVSGTYFSDYGISYAAVATHATGSTHDIITITSPVTTSSSDVKVLLSAATDAASTISNTAWAPTSTAGVQAATYVSVIDAEYTSSATYKIDYVTVDSMVDPYASANATNALQTIVRAGTAAGASSYLKGTDYQKAGNTIDWNTSSWANASVVATTAGTYNTSTLKKLYISINGGAVLTVSLTSGATTAASVLVSDINSALAASSSYGPEFAHTASVSGSSLAFAVVPAFKNFPLAHGYATSIIFYTGAEDAFSLFFGSGVSQPYETRGTGLRPSFGAAYYSTYEYARPSTDYNVPHKAYDPSEVIAYTSPLTDTNYLTNNLAVAGQIAFENRVSALWLVQIDDSTAPGTPTTGQIHAAIDSCADKTGVTDIVVLDTASSTSLDSTVYLMNHVSNYSSAQEAQPCRGWYGMASGTEVGDPDTPDTFVYRSVRTLQPGNTSPGRGRQILVAPGTCSRTLTLDDRTEVARDLDGSFIATAYAAMFTALPSDSSAMVRSTITGFDIDTFETYKKGERGSLASQGVSVITLDAGNLRILDPLTTESGGVVQYEEPSASWQKDVVTRTVSTLLDKNMVGVVPNTVFDFISTTTEWIAKGLEACITNGTIAPYKGADGNARALNMSTDIKVMQDKTDARTFRFRYWFNLRYPAKRLFGDYSVDNPFWVEA